MARFVKYFLIVILLLLCIPFTLADTYITNMSRTQTNTNSDNNIYFGYLLKINIADGSSRHWLYNATVHNDNNGYSRCNLWNATSNTLLVNTTYDYGAGKCDIAYELLVGTTYFLSMDAVVNPPTSHAYSRLNTIPATNGKFINISNGAYKVGGADTIHSYVNGYHFSNITVGTVPASPPSNSCTYTSGDWTILNTDNCNITTTVTMNASSILTLNGTGGTTANRLYVTGVIRGFSTFKTLGTNTLFWGVLG